MIRMPGTAGKLLLPLLVWVVIAPQSVFAQSSVSESGMCVILGTVRDAGTHEPIGAANVIVVGLPRGAATDLDGSFLITHLLPGTYSVTASALGYTPRTIDEIAVRPTRNGQVEFLLDPAIVEGEEVTIIAEAVEADPTVLPTSSRSLRYEEVRRAPGAIEDVQRMVQSLPGVVNSNDSDNEVVVRGGSPVENLTVIDGIEVNNTNHLTFGAESQGSGGPINALNTEFLEDVTFASGGFSAKYGDRMSSVLDLNLREGNRERAGGAIDLSQSGFGGHFETPIANKQGSLLWTIHRSYLELISEDALPTAVPPVYWSSQAKAVYDLSDRNTLTINGFYSEDGQTYRPEDVKEDAFSAGIDGLDFNTEKNFYGARLRSLWGGGFTDLVLARTNQYAHWNQYEQLSGDRLALSTSYRRRDITHQAHFHATGRARGKDEWGAGFSVKPVEYDQELFVVGDSVIFNDDVLGGDPGSDPDTFYYDDTRINVAETMLKTAAYVQYTWRPLSLLSLTGGLRYDALDVSGYSGISPRISLILKPSRNWTISGAWGVYTQSQDPSIYFDPAAPENKKLDDSEALQYIAGVAWTPRPSSRISLEGYYKVYDRLLVPEEEVIRETTGDHTFQSDLQLPDRTKTAWGVEFFAHQKLARRWYGTFSYSYGVAEAEDPAYGSYPSDYDMRHVTTLVAGYRTTLLTSGWWRSLLQTPVLGWALWAIPINGDELTVSTRYRYITGRPRTDQIWYPEGVVSPEQIYEGHWEAGRHNAARFDDYSRWDLRLDSKYWFGRSALVVYVTLQNVLDEVNVADYFYDDNGQKYTIEQFRQIWVMGIRYEF